MARQIVNYKTFTIYYMHFFKKIYNLLHAFLYKRFTIYYMYFYIDFTANAKIVYNQIFFILPTLLMHNHFKAEINF